MIQRNGLGDYSRTSKKSPATQRKIEDFDLRFSEYSVYVLGENEWWDPMTSTKHYNGVSPHAMYGPSVVIFENTSVGHNSIEYHVNDPRVWVWVQTCIKERYLNAETSQVSILRYQIDIKPEPKKPRKRKETVS
jgi:hypothetical protein